MATKENISLLARLLGNRGIPAEEKVLALLQKRVSEVLPDSSEVG